MYKKYVGQKIQLPKDSILILKNNNILPIKKFNFQSNKIKIVTQINGHCHICVHQLDQWKQEIIKEFDPYNIQFIFYLFTDNYKLFKSRFYYRISGSYPLLIDTTKSFTKINKLPKKDKRFHTFLLDSNNEIILIGNPLYNENLKELYKREIERRIGNNSGSYLNH